MVRLVWALLAAGLVCEVAWALTANVWWSLSALLIGVGLVVAAVWFGG
jgi:hypothetical protein